MALTPSGVAEGWHGNAAGAFRVPGTIRHGDERVARAGFLLDSHVKQPAL
jgi:hypothetical protein